MFQGVVLDSTSSSVGAASGLSGTRNSAATCFGARRAGVEPDWLEVLDGTYGASNKDEPPVLDRTVAGRREGVLISDVVVRGECDCAGGRAVDGCGARV